jgi:hypothetical protein
MRKIENHCCDCAVPAYPCIGHLCDLVNVEVFYCDECGDEIGSDPDDVYEWDGQELCRYCYEQKTEEDEEDE